jgi:FtsH-binding integral membrane protein
MNTTVQTVDEGLRQYLVSVYNKMTAALAVSATVAWVAQPLVAALGSWNIALAFLPLAFILALQFMDKMSETTAHLVFYAYAAATGLSLSTLFLVFTLGSIVQVLFISTSVFAAASIYGYTTRSDLTSLGAFLFMGLIGLIVASIVNLFLASSMMSWIISVAAVLIFTGLTAYDTQTLTEEYRSGGSVYGFSSQRRSSIYGALILYLDFINLFIHLLQLLGQKKD